MIRIGICGYGNLGKGVEKAIKYNPDMELVGIFSRRDIQTKEPLIKIEESEKNKQIYQNKCQCLQNYIILWIVLIHIRIYQNIMILLTK